MYAALKDELREQFHFRLYALDGKPVAFSTALVDDDVLIAHRVGIDYTYNQSHKLYQNILYDYVELGIETACKEIQYGRTAMEIKSTIGAIPSPLSVMVRHTNWLSNQLLAWGLPKNEERTWIQRWPFQEPRPSLRPAPIEPSRKPAPTCCLFSTFSFA